jgi:Probable cobalt transporter subunit (CbtA)
MPASRSRNRLGSGHDHATEPTANDGTAVAEVPRSLQPTAGLLTATMTGGVTLGGLVGLIRARALGRLGRFGVRGVSLSMTAIGFVSVSFLPFVAYPPNPPAVSHPDAIGTRRSCISSWSDESPPVGGAPGTPP